MFRQIVRTLLALTLVCFACRSANAQSIWDLVKGVSQRKSFSDPKLDAELPDAPVNVSPRKDVDERLFLLYVLEDMYMGFPVGSDKAALTKNLGEFRHKIDRHYDYVRTKNLDPVLKSLFGDLLKCVDDYSAFLGECEMIEQTAVVRTDKESTESSFRAGVVGGAVGADLYNNHDYNGGDAAIVGIATAVVTYLLDDYKKAKVRDEAKRRAIEAASERLKNSISAALAHAENAANDLADRNGWKRGETGFDQDDSGRQNLAGMLKARDTEGLAKFFDRVKVRRPRDPFAVAGYCIAKSFRQDASPSELTHLAKECVEATSLVPPGKFYDRYRAEALNTAGYLANRAWTKEFLDSGFGTANSKKAKWAVHIWDASLDYDPNDSSGDTREQRAWALMASGRLDDALNQANEVANLRKNTIQFAWNMACLLSCLKKPESIQWFEHAIRNVGFNDIAFAKRSPDLAWVRQTEESRFNDLTDVKCRWDIAWGLISDDIVATNNSPFAITNVKLNVSVTSSGYAAWNQTFEASRIDPGKTYKWNTRISARGSDARSHGVLTCDQNTWWRPSN